VAETDTKTSDTEILAYLHTWDRNLCYSTSVGNFLTYTLVGSGSGSVMLINL